MRFAAIEWSKKEFLVLVGILLLSTLLIAARFNEIAVGSFTDDAYYVEMARSIAEGLGPVVNVGPDVPVQNPDIFPPGFPVLLSPLAFAFPHSLSALKFIPLLGTLLLFPLCLWLPGPGSNNRMRLALVTVVMLNPWVIAWSSRVLSDNPFSALSLGGLLLAVRYIDAGKMRNRDVLVVALLCAAAVGVRTIGWALVLALTGFWVWRREFFRARFFLVATLVMSAPLWFWVSRNSTPVSGAYLEQILSKDISAAWSLILHNVVHYVGELSVILLPLFGSPVESMMARFGFGGLYFGAAFLVGVCFLFLMGKAVVRFWSDSSLGPRVRLFALYLIVYGAVLANFDGYPSGVQTRLLIPVFPVLVWLVFLGLKGIVGGKFKVVLPLIFGVMIFAALGHNGWRIAHPLRTAVDADGNGFVDPGIGADWVLENVGVDAVVMAQEPLQRHIYFQRAVVGFPEVRSADGFLEVIEEFGVEYVFVGPSVHFKPGLLDETGRAVLRVLEERPDVFRMMVNDLDEGVYVFGVQRK